MPNMLPTPEAIALLERYFSDAMEKKHLHSFYTCCGKCSHTSEAERARIKSQKKTKEGKRKKLICSNTHGSLTEKLHSVTKQENINETYCILLCFVNIETFYDKNVCSLQWPQCLFLVLILGMWWLVYCEGEGLFCLLCRVHNTKNKYNKQNTFKSAPSTNYKHSAEDKRQWTYINSNLWVGEKEFFLG